jgi:putative SOS response-associated peptidase YedK
MLQDDNVVVDDAPEDDGDGAPRQSYNFAPGYHGIVYRADVPDWGAGPRREHGAGSSKRKQDAVAPEEPEIEPGSGDLVEDFEQGTQSTHIGDSNPESTHYKLQSMKWGLIPFWTKRNPDYTSMLKTINCRDDSLAAPGGMWASMKARKRCIVVAQGFYEWLKPPGPGSRDKIPHFVRRKDGKLMCIAGLWDCVRYDEDGDESSRNYTYTVITTSSNKQLKFLHDRMPVILDQGSEGLRTWVDPKRHEWSAELQALLKPYEGELEVYPVSKEVGKVGNNSPSFMIPVASKDNKNNIANFFAKGGPKKEMQKTQQEIEAVESEQRVDDEATIQIKPVNPAEDIGETGPEVAEAGTIAGFKRGASPSGTDGHVPVKKQFFATTSPVKFPSPTKEKQQPGRQKISATSNNAKSPAKRKGTAAATQKITKFFSNGS